MLVDTDPYEMQDQENSVMSFNLPCYSDRPKTNENKRKKHLSNSCLLRPSTQCKTRNTSVMQIEEETSKNRYTTSGVHFYKAEESTMQKRVATSMQFREKSIDEI